MLNFRLLEKFNDLRKQDYILKYKNEFKIVFENLKKTIQNNKELKNIFLKYYKKEPITVTDNYLLKQIIADNLKLVGLSGISILSFPIPGSSFLILFLIKSARKLGINLLPSEFKKTNESYNDELIDITKLSQNDWFELQYDVLDDCFPNIKLEIIPVKIVNNKNFSAAFSAKMYRSFNTSHEIEVKDKCFKFNKKIKWNKQKLKNIMAHEMIHYYLFSKGEYNAGHGIYFKSQMNRINNLNNGYKVTLNDDEFILTDDEAMKKGVYFFYLLNDKNEWFNYSSNDITALDEYKNILKTRYNINKIMIYQLPKSIEIKYGIRNQRNFKLVRYYKNVINEIINNADVELVKTITI